MIKLGLYGIAFGLTFATRVIKAVATQPTDRKPVKETKCETETSCSTSESDSAQSSSDRSKALVPASSAVQYLKAPFSDVVTSVILRPVARLVLLFRQAWQRVCTGRAALVFAPNPVQRWIAWIRAKHEALTTSGDGVFEYAVVTTEYLAFTITDGAIRMLVLFQFYLLGYSAFQIASLFLFYEIFGVITNFVGGWAASHMGLKFTLFGGTALQIVALLMLVFMNPAWSVGFLVTYTMVSQALSGIAKDLNKMSAKSAIKAVIPKDAHSTLYRWVSILTGSKNALKGFGFFVGAMLLTVVGFSGSALIMATGLAAILVILPKYLPSDIGKVNQRSSIGSMFALDLRINILSAARFFLFGARDVWFVVALPVYMASVFGWSPIVVGAYLALWTIGYGIVQALAPRIVSAKKGEAPKSHTVIFWSTILSAVPATIALALMSGFSPALSITGGLALFGVIFALNSAIHSFMIVHYADSEKVAMSVGFYYMANAGGRLIGTVLSGWIYQVAGIVGCLWVSTMFVAISALISTKLTLSDKSLSPPERPAIEQKPVIEGQVPIPA